MKYFRITDDINFLHRWHLGDIKNVENNWIFTYSSIPDEIPAVLHLEIYEEGNEMDFTQTGRFSVPIVSERLKRCLQYVEGVKFIPVKIDRGYLHEIYYILIIKNSLDCVDEEHSRFEKFKENDPVRPDKAGEYKGFAILKIDKRKITHDVAIFRLGKFNTAIIINEKVKEFLTNNGVTGISYFEV